MRGATKPDQWHDAVMARQYSPSSPSAVIMLGAILGAFGGVLLVLAPGGAIPGILLLVPGCVLTLIGSVAAGIELASARRDWIEQVARE